MYRSQAFRARYAFPISSPPIPDFHFTFNSSIEAIGEKLSPDFEVDLGNAAIVPWLSNAHTHLELSGFEQPLGDPSRGFPAWIRDVIQWRRSQSGTVEERAARRQAAVTKGLLELRSTGVWTVHDIASSNWENSLESNPGQLVYEEILGLSTTRADALYQQASETLLRNPRLWGLSPHAPYTVGIDLLARLASLSAERKVPLAMHLAESRDELELLRSHSGAFHALLCDIDAWDAAAIPRGIGILDYLKVLATADSAFVTHGNYLNDEELDFLAAHHNLTVVFCPRTHAYFGHSRYPLPEMLERGIRVRIGTDSRASNPDLNIWNELRFVADTYPELPLDLILQLAVPLTEREPWQVDNPASFVIVDLPDEDATDPYELLFDPRARIREGYYQGRPVKID